MNLFFTIFFIFFNSFGVSVCFSAKMANRLIELSKYKIMKRRIEYSQSPIFQYRGRHMGARKTRWIRMTKMGRNSRKVRRVVAENVARKSRGQQLRLRKISANFFQH